MSDSPLSNGDFGISRYIDIDDEDDFYLGWWREIIRGVKRSSQRETETHDAER